MKQNIIKIVAFIILLFTFTSLFTIPVKAEEKQTLYVFKILDDANLLTQEEESQLYEYAEPILEHGNVIVATCNVNSSNTESAARRIYTTCFGEQTGTIFLIDMDNRNIYIHSYGKVLKYVKPARADEITANTFTYATDGDYYRCTKESLIQIGKVLNNEIVFAPLRYITGIFAGICFALLINIFIVCNQRNHKFEINDITENNAKFAIVKKATMLKQTRTRHTSSSGGGGGGGGGHSW